MYCSFGISHQSHCSTSGRELPSSWCQELYSHCSGSPSCINGDLYIMCNTCLIHTYVYMYSVVSYVKLISYRTSISNLISIITLGPSDDEGEDDNIGPIVGGVVGGIVAVILVVIIIVVIYIFFCRSKSKYTYLFSIQRHAYVRTYVQIIIRTYICTYIHTYIILNINDMYVYT